MKCDLLQRELRDVEDFLLTKSQKSATDGNMKVSTDHSRIYFWKKSTINFGKIKILAFKIVVVINFTIFPFLVQLYAGLGIFEIHSTKNFNRRKTHIRQVVFNWDRRKWAFLKSRFSNHMAFIGLSKISIHLMCAQLQ